MSYRNQSTRFQVESSRYENGRLLVTVKGLKGERFEDVPLRESHGFHSRPHAGAVGHIYAAHGNRSELFFSLGSDDAKIPRLEPGEAAMYDATGNVVKLTSTGWEFSMDVQIKGNVHITGNLHATGSVTDGDGDGGA